MKTAWAGADPNWGRILAAIGRSGVPLDPARVDIFFGKQQVCRKGEAVSFDEKSAHLYLSQPQYEITIQLGRGKSSSEFLTCDLTAAYEISHYRPKERPNSVKIVHPKNGEEAWWPLFDETGEPLFPELMAELDAIKETIPFGLIFRRDHKHRRSRTPLPWITERKDLRYLRSVVKKIVAAAGLRSELSFTSFRHGGFTEGADSDLTDAELRAAARHRSTRQLPTYAKRTRKQLISGSKKRREERTKAALVPSRNDT